MSERSLKPGIVVAIFIATFPFAKVLGFSGFVLKRDFFVAFEEQSKSLAVAVDRALECGQRHAMAALNGLIGGLLDGFESIEKQLTVDFRQFGLGGGHSEGADPQGG